MSDYISGIFRNILISEIRCEWGCWENQTKKKKKKQIYVYRRFYLFLFPKFLSLYFTLFYHFISLFLSFFFNFKKTKTSCQMILIVYIYTCICICGCRVSWGVNNHLYFMVFIVRKLFMDANIYTFRIDTVTCLFIYLYIY